PAHDDSNPSLTVAVGEEDPEEDWNSRVLLRCWAGCPLEAIAEALGFTVRQIAAMRVDFEAETDAAEVEAEVGRPRKGGKKGAARWAPPTQEARAQLARMVADAQGRLFDVPSADAEAVTRMA